MDKDFLELVRLKLAVPGNEAINVGPDRLAQLRRQLGGRLKPVLRNTAVQNNAGIVDCPAFRG
jgi:hypothetical protein